MLGRLQASGNETVVSRFRTRRVGLLLAYLAYYQERSHSRDELADMLWPDFDAELARRNLRQALSSLRHHLEPPSVPAGAVLFAKQARVSLSSEHVSTDVAEFTRLLQLASHKPDPAAKIETLKLAVDLYRGDFLPGYYEDWVQRERLRLEDQFVAAVQNLTVLCEAAGLIDEAIRYVRLALTKDHLKEDLHACLLRLYLASERPASALKHFEVWKEILASELGIEPGAEVRRLAGLAGYDGPQERKTEVASEWRASAEPDRPLAEARLPLQLTRFFGRSAERARAVAYFAEDNARLVTILGPAGTGKTRFSIEIGRTLSEVHGWNVWFVPLADISNGGQAFDAIAGAMKVQKEPGTSSVALLNAHLAGTNNLLILDNLEHIVESVVFVVEAILREVPGASLLLTSRHSLKLDGERELDLLALPVPAEDTFDLATLGEIATVPSVQLFVDRAQSIHPDFQVTIHNARTIAAICARLDGLPLALEIAAGLSNAFTPSQLLKNLESRLELLRSRRRDLTGRHRSLRGAIDYSYELLSPELQQFFASLSVFRGGFTVEAAERVCLSALTPPDGTAKWTSSDCLRFVLDLQERSLLRSEDALPGCPARFRLLECFREYGAERLGAEAMEELRDRHGRYFVELTKARARQRGGQRLDGEQENRMAALRMFAEREAVPECMDLVNGIDRASQTAREVILALYGSPRFETFEPTHRIRLIRLVANGHIYASEFAEAYRLYRQALALSQEFGLVDQMGLSHRGISACLGYQGRHEEALVEDRQSLECGKQIGDLPMIQTAYQAIGSDLWSMSKFELARTAFEESLKASRAQNAGELSWISLYNLARVNLDLGQLDDGLSLAGEGIRYAQAQPDEFGVSMCLSVISRYHWLRGSLEAAIATSREALAIRRRVGFVYWSLNAIQAHAILLIQAKDFRMAATLLAASRDATKLRREVDNREFQEAVEAAKANLSESAYERAWAAGLTMSLEDAYRMALSQT